MNRLTYLTIALLLVTGLVAAQAHGKEIYTWTDENGVVHYVDTPPDNPNAVSMEAPEAYRPGSSDSQAVESPPESDIGEASEDDPGSAADQKRASLAAEREERRAHQAKLDETCARARQQLENLEPARRVFFTNEKGETERLDDEERVKQVENLKNIISDNCE